MVTNHNNNNNDFIYIAMVQSLVIIANHVLTMVKSMVNRGRPQSWFRRGLLFCSTQKNQLV